MVTIIDDTPNNRKLAKLRWYWYREPKSKKGWLAKRGYVRHMGKNEPTIYLHRIILPNCPPGHVRDHINRDTLDNRSCNLRIITYKESAANRDVRRDKVGLIKSDPDLLRRHGIV